MSEVLAQLEKIGGSGGISVPDNTYYEWSWVGGGSKWQQFTYTDGTTFHNTPGLGWSGVFNVKGKSTMTFSFVSGMRLAGIKSDGTLTVLTQASSVNISGYDLVLVGQYDSSTITNNMKIS